MKFSSVHYRGHNMYRWIRRQWFAQSRKKIMNTPMREILESQNIQVYDAMEVVKEPRPLRKILNIPPLGPAWPKADENHPLYKEKLCLFYRDHNVLVEGLNQAKNFTNTIEIEKGLPQQVKDLFEQTSTEEYEEQIQMALASAVVYDATQEKLPRQKNPENPAWKYPREYGITDKRKNYILCNRFLNLCELISGIEVSKNRYRFKDAFFSLPLLREDDIIQLQMRADILLLSDDPLPQIINPQLTLNTELPDIQPLKYCISLEEDNFYELKTIFPLKNNASDLNLHTAIIHFNETEVKNIFETPVLEDQTVSRSLMKSFMIAATKARAKFGENVSILPEPIVVQCIQTDARYFHFSVFQLNTLSWPPSNSSVRNVFWHDAMIPAYEFGGFYEARPTISSYNSDVFRMFLTFYKNK